MITIITSISINYCYDYYHYYYTYYFNYEAARAPAGDASPAAARPDGRGLAPGLALALGVELAKEDAPLAVELAALRDALARGGVAVRAPEALAELARGGPAGVVDRLVDDLRRLRLGHLARHAAAVGAARRAGLQAAWLLFVTGDLSRVYWKRG